MTVLYHHASTGGVQTTVYTDPDHRTPILRHQQDTRPILEDNKRWANAYERAWQDNPIRARRVASIPFVVWQQLERMGVVSGMRVIDERRFLRLLSDPELRFLRTDNGGRLA